jgi:hypothetical protein
MSSPETPKDTDLAIPFSPFYTILRAGVDRLLEFAKSESFTFLVNGSPFASTLSEAISLSPTVCECLRANPLLLSFSITSDAIDSAAFGAFLDFARCRESVRIERGRAVSFVSICGFLGNESLALLLLSSLSSFSGDTPPSRPHRAICEATTDECASHFHSFSADDLRFLDRQTLHRLLSSDFLLIENEDWLLRLLLDVGVDRSEFFGHIELSFLSSSGLSLFINELDFDDLSVAIWLKVRSHLKGILPSAIESRRYHKRLESLSLGAIPSELSELCGQSLELLYRGSRDGFRASNFHDKCDGRLNTVTVIETTKGYIFGGFTPLAWDSSNSGKPDNSGKSFLFTIKNPRGNQIRKFGLKSSSSAAIGYISSYGPIFCSNHDNCVYDACNTSTNNSTNLGGSYTNDTGIDGKKVLTGEYRFIVKEIEVFTITR